jgi:3-dehydroquinate synthase
MDMLTSGSCRIFFGPSAYAELGQLISPGSFSKIVLLTDSNTRTHCLPVLAENMPEARDWPVLEIRAGEVFKNIHTCLELWEQLSALGADRKSLMINLGGGVVTDLGGFVASAYQRGIAFVNIPTTLLSMVDASVGGKTGVDLGHLKNQIGLINNPELVLIRPEYLQTLDRRQLKSGFAEMLKHGLIRDKSYWDTLKNLESLDGIEDFIPRSVQLKEEVVTSDPTEKGLRKILNFGHTLGHAIESHFLTSPGPLLHGEAIAIGMVLEAHLSVGTCGFPMAQCDEIKAVLLKFFPGKPLTTKDRAAILSLLRFDKKNDQGRVRFSLLEGIGQAVTDREVSPQLLEACFDYYTD